MKTKLLTTLLLLSTITVTVGACNKGKSDEVESESSIKNDNLTSKNTLKPINGENKKIYKHDSGGVGLPKIDYSGNGTIITRPIDTIACEIESTQPYKVNSELSIPVYYGKYKEGNWWDWTFDSRSWSDWSPTRKRENIDYYAYRGETTLEYQIEERKEYRFCRKVLKPKYKYKYVTWFRGSKWWNSLITYFVTDDYKYHRAPANFYVYDRYKTSIIEYNLVTEYDYTWRTNANDLSFLGIGYEKWDERLAYRYRFRTTSWNEMGYQGRENVPLYHSLYNKDGTPIKQGIMLESDIDLSGSYVGSEESSKSDFYKTKCFYIPTSLIEDKIIYDIVLNHTDSDQISTDAYIGLMIGGHTLSGILKLLVKKYSTSAILKSLGSISTAFAYFIDFLSLANQQSKANKKREIKKFLNILEQIDDYNLLSVSYSYYNPVGITFVSKIPSHSLSTSLVDRKDTHSDDVEYISMDFFDNKKANSNNYIPYYQFDDCKSYYGRISYMEDFSNLYETAERYFTSFDIYDYTTWFE